MTLAVAMVAIVTTGNYLLFVRQYSRDVRHDLTEKASVFTALADETKNHVSMLQRQTTFDRAGLLAEVAEAVKQHSDYTKTRFYQTIPVVAGWSAAREAAKREGLDFKVPAFDARNPLNEPEKGSFRATLLRDLTEQVRRGGPTHLGRVDTATNQLHYMRAITLDDSCMMCHGDPAKNGAQNDQGQFTGKDLLGFRLEGWKPGDMRGAYEVIMPLSGVDAQVAGFVQSGVLVTFGLVTVGCGVFLWLLRVLFTKPIAHVIKTANEIVQTNDLTRRVATGGKDELGQISAAFDRVITSLGGVVSEVKSSSDQVAAASTQIAASPFNTVGNDSRARAHTCSSC